MSITTLSRFRPGLLALAALALACSARAADWPPQLQSLLDDYRDGRIDLVARSTLQLATDTADPLIRREARALYALTLLNGPERRERLSGRSILAELASQDAEILERPDCLLASGLASIALAETPAALNELDLAASKFLEMSRPDLAARSLRALADAWARHAEWERTPSQLNVPTPAGGNQVRSTRIAQIELVRARIAELPSSPARLDALAAVDLTFAEVLFADAADAPRAVELLRAAIDSNPDPVTLAALARRLAAQYEQLEQWTDAAALHRRVADLSVGEPSDFAARRLAEITRTDVQFNAPPSIPPNQTFTIGLSVRNAPKVRYELRRLDLTRFLTDAQGRFFDARLPDDGALAASADLDTPAPFQHGWWKNDAIAIPPLPPGAYALIVRASDSRAFKRLLISTDFHAAVITGSQRLLAWAYRDNAVPLDSATLEFWMHGSFNPTRVSFADGVAASILPPESRVMRERAWVALVRAGDHIALCRGELAPRPADKRAELPSVSLMPSAIELFPGETLSIAGLLFPPAGIRALLPANLQMDVIDVEDRLYWSQNVAASADGAFLARLPITAAMTNRTYRIVIRSSDGVLTNLARQTTFAVRESEGWEGLARIRLPEWTTSADDLFRARLRSAYPWGTPYTDGRFVLRIEGVQLPDDASPIGTMLESAHEQVEINPQGNGEISRPLSDLGIAGPNAALAVTARIDSHDRYLDTAYASTLVTPRPVQVFITQSRGRGGTSRATVRIIDPLGLAADEPPSLHAHGPDSSQPLKLSPHDDGFISAEWSPQTARFTSLVATQKLRDGTTVSAEVPSEMKSPSSAESQLHVRAWSNASQSGARSATVEVYGSESRPLLAILDDGEPRAGVPIRLSAESATATIPISRDVSRSAVQVLIAAMSADGLTLLSAADVELDSDAHSAPQLVAASLVVSPGATLPVEITLPTEVPTSISLRLVDLTDVALDSWWAAFTAEAPPRDILTSLRFGGPQSTTAAATDGVPRVLSRAAREALLGGTNSWVEQRLVTGGRWPAQVPIPDRPGRYRLIAAARLSDGRIVNDSRTIVAAAAPRAQLFVPEVLEIGDRPTAIAVVDNPTREPLEFSVRLEAGSNSSIAASAPTRLHVEAGATERVVLTFEPARVGHDVMSVTFTSGSVRLEARAVFDVVSSADAPGGGLGAISDKADLVVNGGASHPARIHLQADLADVVLDAADEWLDAPFDSTAVLVLQCSWADALLTLNPGARDEALNTLLAFKGRGGIATRRLEQFGALTLGAFHEVTARKLAAARAPDGGWPRWEELATDAEITAWALVVLTAPAAKLAPVIDLRPSFAFLTRSVPVAFAAKEGDARMPRLLAAAVAATGGVNQGAIFEQRDKWQRALDAVKYTLTSAERATWAFALSCSGGNPQTRRLLGHATQAPRDDQSRWEIVLSAAARAIAEEDEHRVGLSALLASRTGVGWGEPLLTALALQAVARITPVEPRNAPETATVTAENVTRSAPIDGNWRTNRHFAIEAERIRVSGCLTAAVESPAPTDPNLRIGVKRTLFRVVPVTKESGEEEWEWLVVTPNQPIAPGTIVVVRDEIEPPGALTNVEWVQRHPGTARSWRPKTNERHLGRIAQRNGEHAVFVTRRLEGPVVHDLWLITSRPGVCAVPPPQVTVDGVRATVEISPARSVVRVEE